MRGGRRKRKDEHLRGISRRVTERSRRGASGPPLSSPLALCSRARAHREGERAEQQQAVVKLERARVPRPRLEGRSVLDEREYERGNACVLLVLTSSVS